MKQLALVLLVAALAVACDRRPEPPMADDEFVATMVELRRAALLDTSDAGFAARRDEILARRGVSEAELQAYADWAGEDPEKLREVLGRISEGIPERTAE